jgi:hypothetical protein
MPETVFYVIVYAAPIGVFVLLGIAIGRSAGESQRGAVGRAAAIAIWCLAGFFNSALGLVVGRLYSSVRMRPPADGPLRPGLIMLGFLVAQALLAFGLRYMLRGRRGPSAGETPIMSVPPEA